MSKRKYKDFKHFGDGINGIEVSETEDYRIKVKIGDTESLLEDAQAAVLIELLTKTKEHVKWKRNMWIKGIEVVAVA